MNRTSEGARQFRVNFASMRTHVRSTLQYSLGTETIGINSKGAYRWLPLKQWTEAVPAALDSRLHPSRSL